MDVDMTVMTDLPFGQRMKLQSFEFIKSNVNKVRDQEN